jgi:Escherichia/Staphylococcus phage prohead protease
MQHLIAKATTVETEEELGVFEAIVSAWAEDRVGDTILPTAYDKTIRAWRESGKWLPLLFEHSTKAIGEIDPESLTTDAEGLHVRGHVDQSTEEGEQVWRQIKSNTASFSIGFASESRPRKGGKGREIYEIDLLEISATSTPVHPSARVLSWKSTERKYDVFGQVMSYEEMVEQGPRLARERERESKAARPIKIVSFEC